MSDTTIEAPGAQTGDTDTAPFKPRLAARDGKRRKFLCIVDDTPECAKAVHFASRRARHTHGGVTLLYVLKPADFQHWAAVEAVMRQEAREAAEEVMKGHADHAFQVAERPAELLFREGEAREVMLELIGEDKDIAVLVLGAGVGNDGPGPLVSGLLARDLSSGSFPVPVTIVPGHLTDEEINFLA